MSFFAHSVSLDDYDAVSSDSALKFILINFPVRTIVGNLKLILFRVNTKQLKIKVYSGN